MPQSGLIHTHRHLFRTVTGWNRSMFDRKRRGREASKKNSYNPATPRPKAADNEQTRKRNKWKCMWLVLPAAATTHKLLFATTNCNTNTGTHTHTHKLHAKTRHRLKKPCFFCFSSASDTFARYALVEWQCVVLAIGSWLDGQGEKSVQGVNSDFLLFKFVGV